MSAANTPTKASTKAMPTCTAPLQVPAQAQSLVDGLQEAVGIGLGSRPECRFSGVERPRGGADTG